MEIRNLIVDEFRKKKELELEVYEEATVFATDGQIHRCDILILKGKKSSNHPHPTIRFERLRVTTKVNRRG